MSKPTVPKASKVSSVSPKLRARILEGAAQAFGDLGYADVRVEDIIEAAGVSRPTFYKVHASKDDVFRALSERHHREIRRRIQEAVATAGADPASELLAMIDAFMGWRAGLGPIGRVLDLEARSPGNAVIAHHRSDTLQAMTGLLTGRMQAAARPAPDPVMVTGLISAMESVADVLLLDPDFGATSLQRAIEIALRIVGASLAGPSDPLPPFPERPGS